MVEEARRKQNKHLRRFWMSTASLLSMVPDAHLKLEIHFLRQEAAMTNEFYLAQVVRWIQMGKRPILTDRMLDETHLKHCTRPPHTGNSKRVSPGKPLEQINAFFKCPQGPNVVMADNLLTNL